jgi:5-methylthioribose kinase
MLFMERDEICAHGHLHSKNIFVNLRDMQVLIGDYGLYSLKKFMKIFEDYEMINNYSPPEVWET